MFDPTAYENLKVILEGQMYDFDFNEAIKIAKRDDFVNLANLSRNFRISFYHPKDFNEKLEGSIELSANFQQLASEWYPFKEQPGANIVIQYVFNGELNEIMEKRMTKFLKEKFPFCELEWMKRMHSSHRISYLFSLIKEAPLSEESIEELNLIALEATIVLQKLYELISPAIERGRKELP